MGGIAGSFGDLFTKLHPGDSVSYRFTEEGVYPYACMLHPGMGGTVVVGDGSGKASVGAAVEVVPPKADAPRVGEQPASAATEPSDANRSWLIPLGVVLGVALLGLAAIPRRRREGPAAL